MASSCAPSIAGAIPFSFSFSFFFFFWFVLVPPFPPRLNLFFPVVSQGSHKNSHVIEEPVNEVVVEGNTVIAASLGRIKLWRFTGRLNPPCESHIFHTAMTGRDS